MKSTLLLLLLGVSSCVAAPGSLQCGVCKALVKEIRYGLGRTAGAHMNLDLRGRLDSKGQRHGKVVDYAVSESRAMDVLEGVCDNMKDYIMSESKQGVEIVKMNNNNGEPVSFSGSMSVGGQDTTKLKAKCETLLEEYEEAITEHIQRTKEEQLQEQICARVAQSCPAAPKAEL